MLGGGGRRNKGNNNKKVFSALDASKKKKKSDKERKNNISEIESKEAEPEVFWVPTPIFGKSWADVDDDDDDDYIATTVPLQLFRQESEPDKSKENQSFVEDSEGEEYTFDEGDDGEVVEEEHDHEPENEVEKPAEVSVAPKVSKRQLSKKERKRKERQLSKKERKRKELAELDALLADFGVTQKYESIGAPQDKKDAETNYGENKENMNAESKSSKKKKKKDKASKDKANVADTNNVGSDDVEVAAPENTEEDASAVDVKEQLKKVASMKKKNKSSKEMDAAIRAAAQEAARNARLAAQRIKTRVITI